VTLPIGKRVRAAAISAAAAPFMEGVGATYHWLEHGVEHLERLTHDGRPAILAWWHGRTLASVLYFRDRQVLAMTSASADGEIVARIIRRFGYQVARGSSSRGGVKALVLLRKEMTKGASVAFAIDGPRGPARVAGRGAVWLAGTTGNPILPVHTEASKFWSLRSWDRHQIPKPGSHVAIAIGAPLTIPDTEDATIEAGQRALEQSLVRLEAQASAMIRKTVSAGH